MTTTTFAMRRATPADKAEVVALSRAVSEHDFIPEIYDDLMNCTEPEGFFVAEQEGRIIGCYCLEFHAPEQAYFFGMRIHPGAQGKGIGSQFCRAQIEQALAAGAREIYLLSALDNLRAHRTVAKNGFVNRGPWVIYDSLTQLPALPEARRARWARPADREAIERFRQARATGPLAEVIASRLTGWAVVTTSPAEWALESTALVEGEGGLEGLMLLTQTEDGLLLRWLDGSPGAAADLLSFALRARAERGLEPFTISLPMAAEPLLAPLQLSDEQAFRAYVFHFPPGTALPEQKSG
ncbi:MAG: GNAT family N-acetyltransferase [Bacillota bacterium]